MKSPVRTFYRHFHNPTIHKQCGSLTAMLDVDFNNCQFIITFARCSKEDNFSREKGRTICAYDNRLMFPADWNSGLTVSENIEVCLKNLLVSYDGSFQLDKAELEEVKQIFTVFSKYKKYYDQKELYSEMLEQMYVNQ
jgi:hypothetical protein